MRDEKLNSVAAAVVSALPLFYGSTDVNQAAFLAGSALFSVLAFEIVFSMTRKIWPHSFHSLLALIVTSSVLSAISMACDAFWFEENKSPTSFFFLTLVSAFLLVHTTGKSEATRTRLWARMSFAALLLMIGLARGSSEAFQMFPAAALWIAGLALGVFFFLKRAVRAK